jgi:hypothetical protein
MSHDTQILTEELAHEEATSDPILERPPTYHEARRESKPPSYLPSLAPSAEPRRRRSQLDDLMEFKKYHETTMSNYGALKGTVTGPAKDPVALFRWMGKKVFGDKGETMTERRARIRREWEADMKANNGIGAGEMDTSNMA